jgi:hypothetical protein
MSLKNGKTYVLRCPGGCGKVTGKLQLDRPFDPKRDDIAYCDTRKTCPLPKRPMLVNVSNLGELRKAQFRASCADLLKGCR